MFDSVSALGSPTEEEWERQASCLRGPQRTISMFSLFTKSCKSLTVVDTSSGKRTHSVVVELVRFVLSSLMPAGATLKFFSCTLYSRCACVSRCTLLTRAVPDDVIILVQHPCFTVWLPRGIVNLRESMLMPHCGCGCINDFAGSVSVRAIAAVIVASHASK